MTIVANEVAFGLENLGVAAAGDLAARRARARVGGRAPPLGPEDGRALGRRAAARLPRVGARARAAAAAARRADVAARPRGGRAASSPRSSGSARPSSSPSTASARALELATRVLFVDGGRAAPRRPARGGARVAGRGAPALREGLCCINTSSSGEAVVAALRGVSFAYREAMPVLDGVDLELRRGEIVALEGPNGSGKTTLARIAAGLLEPQAGTVELRGRAGYLSQDPGRYLVKETALAEVALAVNGDEQRARRRARPRRARLGGRPPPARPLERRARAARARVGRRRRTGPARPGRADARPRPGAEGGARPPGSQEYAASGKAVLVATHDRDLPAHRRIGLSVETTQASDGALALPSRVAGLCAAAALALAAWAALDPAAAGSRRCSPPSPCSPPASPGSRAARCRRAT